LPLLTVRVPRRALPFLTLAFRVAALLVRAGDQAASHLYGMTDRAGEIDA